MASKVLFSVLLLVPMLAATSMADHGAVPNTPGQMCWPGMGYPMYALPRCRAMVKRQCLGGEVPGNVREECCRQLAAVTDSWCRCEALNRMRLSMYKELGVGEGQAEVFPGCRREFMDRAAASVPAVCKLFIPNGSDGVCYWLRYYQPLKQTTSY